MSDSTTQTVERCPKCHGAAEEPLFLPGGELRHQPCRHCNGHGGVGGTEFMSEELRGIIDDLEATIAAKRHKIDAKDKRIVESKQCPTWKEYCAVCEDYNRCLPKGL